MIDVTASYITWLLDVATETGSLVFIIDGTLGSQPVLMPGSVYYWWLDDPTNVHQAPEDDGRTGSGAFIH